MGKFRGEMMTSRLHFKISTSSFQRIFSLCAHERLEATVCTGLSARRPGSFSPTSPKPTTPPHRPPAFHSTSPPNLHRQLPSPRSTAKPSPVPPCSPRPCARSSASSLPPLLFPTRGGPRLAIFVCSLATLEHIDAVTLASPVVRPGLR